MSIHDLINDCLADVTDSNTYHDIIRNIDDLNTALTNLRRMCSTTARQQLHDYVTYNHFHHTCTTGQPTTARCNLPHLSDHTCPTTPQCQLPHLSEHTCPEPLACPLPHLDDHVCPELAAPPPTYVTRTVTITRTINSEIDFWRFASNLNTFHPFGDGFIATGDNLRECLNYFNTYAPGSPQAHRPVITEHEATSTEDHPVPPPHVHYVTCPPRHTMTST